MIQATDSELLMRFSRSRDAEAFRLLVERHGPLVESVCRRVLRDAGDVEDAAQAAFLVLAREAGSIRCRSSVASWLFKVAHRAAIRAVVERQRRKEQPLASEPEQGSDVLADLQQRETFELLAAELERLPETYRAPLILLYLEGKSHRDAAEELECSDTVLKGRVARARRLLRQRLSRRGVGLSVLLGAWACSGTTAVAAERTMQAALEYSTLGTAGPACSAHSVSLAEGIQPMTSLALTKSTVAVGSLVLAGLLTAAGVGIHQASAQSGAGPAVQGSAREIATELVVPLVAEAEVPDEVIEVAEEPEKDANRPVKTWSAEEVAMLPTDLEQRSESERKIEAALADPRGVSVEFIQQPLREVMDFFAATFNFPALIEEHALAEEGLSADEPISIAVSGAVPLNRTLNLILEPRDLAYVVEDDVLKVTTRAAAKRKKETRAYPVRDLLDSGIEKESLKRIVLEHAKLTEVGFTMVEGLDGFLAIRQSLPGHRETSELLKQLRHPDQQSAAEKKIEASLLDPRGVDVEFIDQPLREVLDFFAATFDLPIVVEEQGRTQQDVPLDEPINIVIPGKLPLESALNIVLDPLGLAYMIDDDVLKITARRAAAEKRDTRVYPVRDLIDANIPEESLRRTILKQARSTDKDEPVIESLNGSLAISQSLLGHRETAKLLEQVRRAAEMKRQWSHEQRGER